MNRKSGSLRRKNHGIGAGCSYLIIVIRELFCLMSYPGKWRDGVTWEELSRKKEMQIKGPSSLVLAVFILP